MAYLEEKNNIQLHVAKIAVPGFKLNSVSIQTLMRADSKELPNCTLMKNKSLVCNFTKLLL